jgi:TatA/E family protein of Tat protein translocase
LLYLFWQHQYLLLIIILAIVLILSGANRLPQFAKAMGESIRNFKEGYREGMAESDHPKIGRNEDCPCGSGKKYKKCHELKFKAHQRKTE